MLNLNLRIFLPFIQPSFVLSDCFFNEALMRLSEGHVMLSADALDVTLC